jgi:hypothetical protein
VGISKYFSISVYLRKARLIAARTLLKWGVTLRNTTLVDGERITFVATSFIEYFLRAEESYTREEVTMYWIRNCIRPGDVVFDIGANVGAYSLLIGKKVAAESGMVYAFEPEAATFSPINKLYAPTLAPISKTTSPGRIQFLIQYIVTSSRV